jgi:pyrimidine-nucleoside phosphorylase
MDILEIIGKKRDKKKLTKEEIEYFVKEYTNGNIADYQAAALVMAIYINGMTIEETTNLTLAMAYSGDVLDLSSVGNVVDKHSTGGIGDKVTIILMPIVASLGVKVAKMSGRGLGFTGGTKDKLEAIPGYKTEISIEEFINNVNKVGISLIGQTLNLAPADKKLYALRDTINCTANIPLISSSIMSKKIAAGANKVVLDVTCGSGAFMKDIKDAEELSKTMINIGKLANKETVCVITNMDQPLGKMVGNTLEIIEAIEALKGNMQEDVKNVVLELGAYILKLDGKGNDVEENKKAIEEVIANGKAYKKFLELVANQGGDISYIENTEKFEKALRGILNEHFNRS